MRDGKQVQDCPLLTARIHRGPLCFHSLGVNFGLRFHGCNTPRHRHRHTADHTHIHTCTHWWYTAYSWKKTNTTWSKWRAICSRKASYWKGILFVLKACYTLWMKVFVCKACSCQLESFLQEKDAWLVVFSSNLQFFHCLYISGLGKRPEAKTFCFNAVESLAPT